MSFVIDYVTCSDNYIWMLRHADQCVVIDPGEAAPVKAYLETHHLQLVGILITHYHSDHIGGLPVLESPMLPIYGSAYEYVKQVNRPLRDGDVITIFDTQFRVLFTPGHTHGHISYATSNQLFCGDVLFAGGCGRAFEGTHDTLYQSLQRYQVLDPTTQCYCGHEYTVANLAFAMTIDPTNTRLNARFDQEKLKQANAQPTVPFTLQDERDTNPFMRCDQDVIRRTVELKTGQTLTTPSAVFSALRQLKDAQ